MVWAAVGEEEEPSPWFMENSQSYIEISTDWDVKLLIAVAD